MWVSWGPGTPKDKDEVNKRSITTLVRMLPTFDLICDEKDARRSVSRIEDTQNVYLSFMKQDLNF